MDFNEIKRKYNLDFRGLAEILQEHQIILNLEHLNAIPATWIPIIEESLGLVSQNKEDDNEISNEQEVLRETKRMELEARKVELARQREVIKEYRRLSKTKTLAGNDVKTLQSKSIIDEEKVPATQKLKTEYKKVAGPKYRGDKIDLSLFEKERKISKKQMSNRRHNEKTVKSFYAYVKYIGPESDHAFIKLIPEINSIKLIDTWAKDDLDYKLEEDCSSIERGQVILCEIKSKRYRSAKIKASKLEGSILNRNKSSIFIDWLSFDSPIAIPEIKSLGFEDDESLVWTSLFYINNGFRCRKEKVNIVNKDAILEVMEKTIASAVVESIISENSLYYVKSYRSSVDYTVYESFMLALFHKELDRLDDLFTEDRILSFVEKWGQIDSSFLTVANLKIDKFFMFFFELWLDKKLPVNYWQDNLIDSCIKYESLMYESESIVLASKLQNSHIEIISSAIESYFQSDFEIRDINELNVITELVSFSNLTNKERLTQKIREGLSLELSFEQWVKDGNGAFSKDFAINIFPKSDLELQTRILNELSANDILPILPIIREVEDNEIKKKIYAALLTSIASQLSFVSFDIESNGKEIFELGWINNENDVFHFSDASMIQEGVEIFKDLTFNSSLIFIGHNIVEWDVPILLAEDISIPPKQIWDTLLIEGFLSPEFKNYALITAHNAKDDAKLTRDLYLNQLLRIIYMEEDKLVHLFSYLTAETVESIRSLKRNQSLKWNPLEVLETEKKGFYRPQPQPNSLVKQVIEYIAVSETDNVLIVGSEFLRLHILEMENIKFHVDDSTHKDFYKLSKSKIQELVDIDSWLKQVLINFIDYNESLNNPSFYGQLPTSVKIKVENNVKDTFELFDPVEAIEWSSKNKIFLTISEILLYREQLSQLSDINLITIQNDLISVENKILLKEISLDFLMRESQNEDHIWLKFSGGQSFVELSLEQCKGLNVDIPDLFENIWIEKYTLNEFRIWGNYNWEDIIDSFSITSKIDVYSDTDEFESEQTLIVGVSAVETLKSKVIRFNPESLHRSRYWVFQKQLIDQIVIQENPSVLCVQRFDEIEVLENYFRQLGYYVPKRSISIGRRLELLHQNKSAYKLIIEHVNNLDRIVGANYISSLNIIYDSFKIYENYFSSINSNYFKDLNKKRLKRLNDLEESESEEAIIETDVLSTSKKPVISDTFFLIELLKPQVLQIRGLLRNADENHKLWFLDSRLNDFPSIYKSWNVTKRVMNVWKDFEAYEADVKEADIHIDSVKPIVSLPFDRERTKEILRQIFLKDFNWRDSQVPYLDLILEGKENQLITLPTGEGKSVLFQGPALLKGAFSNRLTIVVTPLKALMEDQVESLWNRGFFGSVDYINSDRSSDLSSIYRAVAGGELSLLFVTPERFRSRSFNNALQMRIHSDGGLEYGVFDEAHCVSQWGHEFRPDYFNSAKLLVKLRELSNNKFPLLLFSATVSEKIYNDFKIIFS